MAKITKSFVEKAVKEYLAEVKLLKENPQEVIDNILEKIGIQGGGSLTPDEKKYLSQYRNNSIDKELENWLLSTSLETFSNDGEKLLYDEFKDDEDIFYNTDKLKRVISKALNKTPFTDNASWSGGYVWNIDRGSKSNYVGNFFYLGDDELVVLNRSQEGDEYEDEVLEDIVDARGLYRALMTYK